MNKVQLTINSRLYTVVSDESSEYMYMLGEHINEKIDAVLREGRNIMGERPVVLAALNICDEYYKLAAEKSDLKTAEISGLRDENEALKKAASELREKNKQLLDEIELLESGQISLAETEAIAKCAELQKELDDAQTQVKFLDGQIRLMEDKAVKMKKEYERREQEIFDMFDNPKKG